MDIDKNSIGDFGVQWTNFTSNDGYYGSEKLFHDIVGPNFEIKSLKGKVVGEIGSGTGRIVNMLINSGCCMVYAVEPSDAFEILKINTANFSDKIRYLHERGENINLDQELDLCFSIGVLHHIPNPNPTVNAVFKNLKSGGKFIIWLYGKEGNWAYLFFLLPLKKLTSHLPHWLLNFIAHLVLVPVICYSNICSYFRALPMASYFSNHFNKLPLQAKIMTLYDQLNPTFSKYYSKQEAINLLSQNGFKNVSTYHRHRYSWTVVGEKP